MHVVLTAIFLVMFVPPVWADDAIIDRTEVTIGAFADYADATGTITKAERSGGMVFEAGWVTREGWNWRTPYGVESPASFASRCRGRHCCRSPGE